MRLDHFFRLSWLVQLAVGVTLFTVSLLIEAAVLRAFFAAPLLALALAVALEVGKAVAIIWHRYLNEHAHGAPAALATALPAYPAGTRLASASFRSGLLVLSMLCSLLFLGAQLDRPQEAALREAARAEVDARLTQDLARLDAAAAAERDGLAQRHAREYADVRTDHQGQVAGLERLLRTEMDNVQGRTFKGQRYQELERRLSAAAAERDRALTELAARHAAERATLADQQRAARAAVQDRAARARTAADQAVATDERIHDPRILALSRMLADLFGWHLRPTLFVLVFSLCLAVLMELGILLAFDTLTLAVLPVFAAQHREEVATEAMVATLNANQTRDHLRHRDAMTRIGAAAQRTAERAHAELDRSRRADAANSPVR